MSTLRAFLLLLLAALLEAGGDALVRAGLFHANPARRVLLIVTGGLVLLAYGCAVNAPRWDFGRLLGVYVAFFFVVAQAIAWVFFRQPPTPAVWFGGSLIVLGGIVLTLWGR